jgi:prepilin-type N-terminal cleavage/methylation domain-containing protein
MTHLNHRRARIGACPHAKETTPPGVASRARRSRRGFTLIETALTTVIVGVGVLSIVSAQQAFHQKNEWSTHASIAMHLGNEIREMTLRLPRHDPVVGFTDPWGPEDNEDSVADYDDIDDFDGDLGTGLIFSAGLDNGPINAQRQVISNMDGWSQEIYVYNVDPFDLATIEDDGSTNTLIVEVIVTYQGPRDSEPEEMTRVQYLVPN